MSLAATTATTTPAVNTESVSSKWHDNRVWRHSAGRINALFSVAISGIALAFSLAKPFMRLLIAPLYCCVFKERSFSHDLKRDLLSISVCAERVVRSSWRVLSGERSTDRAFFKLGLDLGSHILLPESIGSKERETVGHDTQLPKSWENLVNDVKEAYKPHELIAHTKETLIRILGITLLVVSTVALITLIVATHGGALLPLLAAYHHIFGVGYAVTTVRDLALGLFSVGIAAVYVSEVLRKRREKPEKRSRVLKTNAS